VHYEVFKGNTFKGNTFIPSILEFKNQHNIGSITVVADSAMLSKQNLEELLNNQINYIIAARLANLKKYTLELIDKSIVRKDQESIRIGE